VGRRLGRRQHQDDTTYDAMHFEIACTPADLKTGIDADGIPGSAPKPVRVDVRNAPPARNRR
jgi:hypothetical protein